MRILLAYPWFEFERAHAENVEALPMGLYSLAAVLIEAGHSVAVADFHAHRGRENDVLRTLADFAPDVVGISCFHENRGGAVAVARLARKAAPEALVVLGGVGATFLYDLLLTSCPQIDYVVLGEGERTLPALLDAVARGEDTGAVPGLAWREGDKTATSPPAEPVADLDALPDPADYFTFRHVAVSRGCPGKCTFCASPAFWGPKVRFHSADYFVNQLQKLASRGIDFFYVSDDTFTLKKDLVLDICERIRRELPQITWAAISRVDAVDDEMLRAMRLAGCIQLSFGVESGSEKIRRTLNKRFDNHTIRRAFARTAAHGILPRAYVIYGNPGESAEDIEQTAALIHEIKPLVTLFYVLSLFPGAALYEEQKRKRPDLDETWRQEIEDLLWFEVDDELDEATVRDYGARLHQAFYPHVGRFAREVELLDDPELAPHHADFLSRLGLTFVSGDYAERPEITDAAATAESLFTRALSYAPDARASLGLGMLRLQSGDAEAAAGSLAAGHEAHPDHEDLGVFYGFALMRLGRLDEAAEVLARFPDSAQASQYLEHCRAAMG